MAEFLCRRFEWITPVLFAVIVSYQLFVPPAVGLANNGDFAKVLGIFDLAAPVEDEYQFLSTTYSFHPKHHIWFGFLSSEQLLAAAAILLNISVSKEGGFDIRAVGVVHASLYLFAFYLLLPLLRELSTISRATLCGVLLLVFGDVMYVSWLNTFYMDTAALLFLMLSVVFYLRWFLSKKRVDQIAFVVGAVLFAGAKSQHCVLALPLVCLLWMGRAGPGKLFRIVSSALILAATAAIWYIVPASYAPTAMYSVIFYEIMPHSKNAVQDLSELGLDASYQKWIGTYWYQDGVPNNDEKFLLEFSSRTSHARIGWFLIRHPASAYRAIRRGLDQAGRQRVAIGNFDRSAGTPAFAESQAFTFWSKLKRCVFEARGSRYFFYFIAVCGVFCAALFGTARSLLPGGVCLCLMAWMALFVSAFGDAVEVTRHFFLFNALADLILVCTVAALLASSRNCPRRKSSHSPMA
jgi:hypothetical protein